MNNYNYQKTCESINSYAQKVGKTAARPALLLFYVMKSPETTTADKLMIASSLAYLILPLNFISAKRLPVIGWLDEAVALVIMVQKMAKRITPEIQAQAEATLDRWFSSGEPECVEAEVVNG